MALIHIMDDGNVRTLTLDRPGGHNAIGPDLLAELAAALTATRADPAIGALILTGPVLCSARGEICKRC